MSVASNNLFAILGDDAEDATPVPLVLKENVKKNTSSKKADAPPPSASKDSSRAARSNRKPAATGNEAAFKERNAVRANNKGKPAEPEGSATHGQTGAHRGPRRERNPRPDRHSQTGKVDTEKKVNKGWGDDSKAQEDEVVGEELAKEDAAEAAEENKIPVEEVDTTKTLDEYFAELSVKTEEVRSARDIRKPNEGSDNSKWQNANEVVKSETEDYFTGSKGNKTFKSKNKKEKVYLDVEPTFAPPSSGRGDRGDRGARRGDRGARRGDRGDRRGAGPRRQERPSVAAVNVASRDEFPVLGA